jgi:HK97 family phage major capsid protein
MTNRSISFSATHWLAFAAGERGNIMSKNTTDLINDMVEEVLKTRNEMKELQASMREVEQRSVRRGGSGGGATASLGSQFTDAKAEELRGMSRGDRVSMEVQASLTSSKTDAPGSAGDLAVPQRDGITLLPSRRLTIRNLLNVVEASSGSVEYVKQTSRATGAGMVAETDRKPESSMQFGLETVPIRTIAHWVKASRQILEDAPQMRGLIDTDLRYGLAVKEESQLLYGDGTGQNLEGMVPLAKAYAPTIVVEKANKIDTIGLAILQASLTDVPPDGIVIHPADWWAMRLTKDADGKYILGDPMAAVQPSLFGLPVVPTQAMEQDDFLVGAFGAQTLYDRWKARVEAGFENDDFTRNMVTVLGEERIGFAAKHPQALITGGFTPIP